MKGKLVCFLTVMVLLVFSSSLWAQCPEESIDLGICDTLYIVPWPNTDTCFDAGSQTICINDPGERFPCFFYVSLFVTHDSNTFYWADGLPPKWVQDSLSGFVVPLSFWHQPVSGMDADSVVLPNWNNWNNTQMNPYSPYLPQSIFRHMDSDTNRMQWLAGQFMNLEWSPTVEIESFSCSGDSGFAALSVLPITTSNRRWWEGSRGLLATWTFMVYMAAGAETTEVCFDSIFWPPGSNLAFTRYDAVNYVPRHELPICFKIYADTVAQTGVRWVEDWSEEEGSGPATFSLSQNYPNPFNPATNIRVTLPKASHVEIEIFNILGQRVRTLIDEDMRAGVFIVNWDGRDQKGSEVSSGVYFYRIEADEFYDVKRMVLMK